MQNNSKNIILQKTVKETKVSYENDRSITEIARVRYVRSLRGVTLGVDLEGKEMSRPQTWLTA
jgi:hypothetical protein